MVERLRSLERITELYQQDCPAACKPVGLGAGGEVEFLPPSVAMGPKRSGVPRDEPIHGHRIPVVYSPRRAANDQPDAPLPDVVRNSIEGAIRDSGLPPDGEEAAFVRKRFYEVLVELRFNPANFSGQFLIGGKPTDSGWMFFVQRVTPYYDKVGERTFTLPVNV